MLNTYVRTRILSTPLICKEKQAIFLYNFVFNILLLKWLKINLFTKKAFILETESVLIFRLPSHVSTRNSFLSNKLRAHFRKSIQTASVYKYSGSPSNQAFLY